MFFIAIDKIQLKKQRYYDGSYGVGFNSDYKNLTLNLKGFYYDKPINITYDNDVEESYYQYIFNSKIDEENFINLIETQGKHVELQNDYTTTKVIQEGPFSEGLLFKALYSYTKNVTYSIRADYFELRSDSSIQSIELIPGVTCRGNCFGSVSGLPSVSFNIISVTKYRPTIINITKDITDISQYLYSEYQGEITYTIEKVDDKDFNASVSGSIFRVESNQSGSCYLVARQSIYTSRVELKWKAL